MTRPAERQPGETGLFLIVGGAQIRVTLPMLAEWLAVKPGQPTVIDEQIAEDILVAVARDVEGRRVKR